MELYNVMELGVFQNELYWVTSPHIPPRQ